MIYLAPANKWMYMRTVCISSILYTNSSYMKELDEMLPMSKEEMA